jgi:hypothetical protein
MTSAEGYSFTHKPVKMNASNRSLADLQRAVISLTYPARPDRRRQACPAPRFCRRPRPSL